jgi:hypothetical protein
MSAKSRGGKSTVAIMFSNAPGSNSETRPLDLNRAHVPTGWVTIEEIIRFMIVDLGVKPPCRSRWPEVLVASERKFFEEFTSKRYISPSS